MSMIPNSSGSGVRGYRLPLLQLGAAGLVMLLLGSAVATYIAYSFFCINVPAKHIAVLTKSLTAAKDKVYSEVEALAILTMKLSHLFISGSPRFQKALKGLKTALE